jgi:DNA-binding NarL/FixJ family response regulator
MRSDILLFGSGTATETSLYWAVGQRSVHLEIARSIEEAMLCLERTCVDILICDDEKAGNEWLELLVQAARLHASLISIVTAHCASMDTLVRSINEGRVFAFLPKPLDRNGLKLTLDAAFSRSVNDFALRRCVDLATQAPSPAQRPALNAVTAASERTANVMGFGPAFAGLPGDLSVREWEVLALLANGLTTRQIAKRLFISVYTVRNHLKSMYRKLQIHSQSELIDWHQASRPQLAAG